MKRIITMLMVAALMVVVLTVSAGTSFAAKCRGETIKPQFECVHGGGPPHVENPGGNSPPGQQPSPGNSG